MLLAPQKIIIVFPNLIEKKKILELKTQKNAKNTIFFDKNATFDSHFQKNMLFFSFLDELVHFG